MGAIRSSLAVAVGLYALTFVGSAQMPAPGSKIENPHVIPDPTPRQPDIRRKYEDDPVERRKLEQAVAVRNKLRQERVISDTDKLVMLAQQLKADIANGNKAGIAYPQALKAEAIEKLAKQVKDKMRSD